MKIRILMLGFSFAVTTLILSAGFSPAEAAEFGWAKTSFRIISEQQPTEAAGLTLPGRPYISPAIFETFRSSGRNTVSSHPGSTGSGPLLGRLSQGWPVKRPVGGLAPDRRAKSADKVLNRPITDDDHQSSAVIPGFFPGRLKPEAKTAAAPPIEGLRPGLDRVTEYDAWRRSLPPATESALTFGLAEELVLRCRP